MDAKLTKIYYGPGGYWKGIAVIKKLAEAAKVPEETAKKWLIKQALWLPGRYSSPRRGEFLGRNSTFPTATWLSACLGTSTPWKCDSLRGSGPLPG